MSPPMPVDVGSVTLRAAPAATAASAALPPFDRISSPAAVAKGCDVATIPLRLYTGERRELNIRVVIWEFLLKEVVECLDRVYYRHASPYKGRIQQMENGKQPVTGKWAGRFFTIWIGQAFSLFGSSIVQFALVWWLTK